MHDLQYRGLTTNLAELAEVLQSGKADAVATDDFDQITELIADALNPLRDEVARQAIALLTELTDEKRDEIGDDIEGILGEPVSATDDPAQLAAEIREWLLLSND